MKINFMMRCLFFIFCVQLLTISTLSAENKLSSSTERNLADHAATTVADIDPEEGGGKALVNDEVKNMIMNSIKSQGKSGTGGGNNVVHGEKKNDAASMLPPSLCFYISVCFTFSLLVLSF